MPVRSEQLYLGQPAAGAVTLYTVPADKRTIVRSWYILNGNAAANTVFMSVAGAGGTILLPPLGVALASFAVIQTERWTVLDEGDQLVLTSSLIGAQALVSGAELQL